MAVALPGRGSPHEDGHQSLLLQVLVVRAVVDIQAHALILGFEGQVLCAAVDAGGPTTARGVGGSRGGGGRRGGRARWGETAASLRAGRLQRRFGGRGGILERSTVVGQGSRREERALGRDGQVRDGGKRGTRGRRGHGGAAHG